ncbi:hypothetical protein F7725_017189, partial [Dissostichus mawsoni]
MSLANDCVRGHSTEHLSSVTVLSYFFTSEFMKAHARHFGLPMFKGKQEQRMFLQPFLSIPVWTKDGS